MLTEPFVRAHPVKILTPHDVPQLCNDQQGGDGSALTVLVFFMSDNPDKKSQHVLPELNTFSMLLLWQLCCAVDSVHMQDPGGPNHSHTADLPFSCSLKLCLFSNLRLNIQFNSLLHVSTSFSPALLSGIYLSLLQKFLCLLFSCDMFAGSFILFFSSMPSFVFQFILTI